MMSLLGLPQLKEQVALQGINQDKMRRDLDVCGSCEHCCINGECKSSSDCGFYYSVLIGVIAVISLVIIFCFYFNIKKDNKSEGTMEGTDSLSNYSNSEKEELDGYRILIERENHSLHSKMPSLNSGSDLQKVTSSSLRLDTDLNKDLTKLNHENIKRSEII